MQKIIGEVNTVDEFKDFIDSLPYEFKVIMMVIAGFIGFIIAIVWSYMDMYFVPVMMDAYNTTNMNTAQGDALHFPELLVRGSWVGWVVVVLYFVAIAIYIIVKAPEKENYPRQ